MWVVLHECPSGARFVFNRYRQWDTLVIRAGNRTGHLINIKEGVTQGDPLDMITYCLGILLLIQDF